MSDDERRAMFIGFWDNIFRFLLLDAEALLNSGNINNIRIRGHNPTSVNHVPEGQLQLWIALNTGIRAPESVERYISNRNKLVLLEIWYTVMKEFEGLVDSVIFNPTTSNTYKPSIQIRAIHGYPLEYLYTFRP